MEKLSLRLFGALALLFTVNRISQAQASTETKKAVPSTGVALIRRQAEALKPLDLGIDLFALYTLVEKPARL